jgi:hypothetical protein
MYQNRESDAHARRDEVRKAEDDKRIRREQEAALEAARKAEETRKLEE